MVEMGTHDSKGQVDLDVRPHSPEPSYLNERRFGGHHFAWPMMSRQPLICFANNTPPQACEILLPPAGFEYPL